MPYLAKIPRPDINNGPGVSRIVLTFWSLHFFKSNWNNGPSPGHSKIRSDGRCTSSSLPFMVWWVPYLNKSLRPEFYNGPEMTWTVAAVWIPWHYSRPTCIMAFPQAILKGNGPDFNNDLGGDSNSCPVLSPRCLFKSNSNNGPSLATPILCQMKYTSVQVSIYDFLVVTISGQGPHAWFQ